MSIVSLGGYVGKMLRIDLGSERLTEWSPDGQTLRKYIGGVGLAAKVHVR